MVNMKKIKILLLRYIIFIIINEINFFINSKLIKLG